MAKKIKKKLIEECIYLCKEIYKNDLAVNSFGNASVYDKKENLIYIKPSGLNEKKLNSQNISVLDTKSDRLISGLKPSVDYSFHKSIYQFNYGYNSIIHTHSTYATILAQNNISPKCIGTTHADYTTSNIPITRDLKLNKNLDNYESELSKQIKSLLDIHHNNFPFILINRHGGLAFGKTSNETIDRAIALEFICKLYYKSFLLGKNQNSSKANKTFKYHYDRKNSKNSFYGQ